MRQPNRWHLPVSYGLFVLATFSKSAAVVLPVVLVLVDYFKGRAWSWRLVVETGPYFLVALPRGVVALSFRVDDIAKAIVMLKSRGVVFADYDFPGLKTEGHVCVLGSEKAAWFEDPEGNILCLHEDLA